MRLFDLHCDTLTLSVPFSGHVKLEHARSFASWAQVYAIFVPDDCPGPAARFDEAYAFYQSNYSAITKACQPILALENAKGNPHRLDELTVKGVRIISLTWNGENELGYGAHCDPALGLKPLGKDLLRRMRGLGILPDVSHLNRAGFWDVAAGGGPILATHSNCAAVHPCTRNLGDEQLRAIITSGGLVGLNLYTEFLGGEGTAADFARHLAHIIGLGGENHVALGSDFDGCEIHPSLAGLDKMVCLDSELQRLGFTAAQREKLFWGNAEGFLGHLRQGGCI